MPQRTNSIGRHLPTSGGLAKTLKSARELGCETVQIFVSNPQGWADPVPRRDADVLAEGARELGVSPVVAHAKYLINLASKNEELRDRSVHALAHEMAAAGALGVDLVVVHAGSHGGDGEERRAWLPARRRHSLSRNAAVVPARALAQTVRDLGPRLEARCAG